LESGTCAIYCIAVTFNPQVDTEPYAKVRDARVESMARNAGVEVKKIVSHTLYVSAGFLSMHRCALLQTIPCASVLLLLRVLDDIGQ